MRKFRRTIALILVVILSLNTFGITSFADSFTHDADFELERVFSATGNSIVLDNNSNVNNRVNLTYRIIPKSIPASSVPDITPPKQVVLVLDTSGSMKRNVAGYNKGNSDPTARINIAKNAAKQFVTNVSSNKKIEIAIATYDFYAQTEIGLTNVSDSSGVTTVHNAINGISASDGYTNIGDGIREAYHLLKNNVQADKFLVFLTDGEPNYYSYPTGNSGAYYLNDGTYGSAYSVAYNKSRSKTYGRTMADKIKSNEITGFQKPYYVAFSNGGSDLQYIANEISDFRNAATAEDLNAIYTEISQLVSADVVVRTLSMTDVIPQGLTVIDKPSNVTVVNNVLSATLGNIVYRRSGDNFIADPIEITITVESSTPGTFNFDNANAQIDFMDLNGSPGSKTFGVDSLTYTRLPIENVVTSRPVHTSGNLDNVVDITWDVYPGGVKYNVYNVVDGIDVLIKTVNDGATNSVTVPIEAGDKATTEYKVEGILSDGEKSGKGSSVANTNPSILNASLTRENDTFIVTWDKIFGATSYNVTPNITGSDLTVVTDQSKFVEVGGKIEYRNELLNPSTYNFGDTIKFKVGGVKPDATVTPDTTNELELKQVVKTEISSNMTTFNYAKARTVDVAIEIADVFPIGLNMYDPVLVIDLIMPTHLQTPL